MENENLKYSKFYSWLTTVRYYDYKCGTTKTTKKFLFQNINDCENVKECLEELLNNFLLEVIQNAEEKNIKPDRIDAVLNSALFDQPIYLPRVSLSNYDLDKKIWIIIKQGFRNSKEKSCDCSIKGLNSIIDKAFSEPIFISFTTACYNR